MGNRPPRISCSVDVGAAPDAERAGLDDRADTRRSSTLELRPHQRDHVCRFGFAVAWLVPRPKIDEDMFVRQHEGKLFGTHRSECRHDAGHRYRLASRQDGWGVARMR